jgi:integrase
MGEMKNPPGLRWSSGNWHYRIKYQGREWTADTGLEATRRNVSAALAVREKARQTILGGQPERLEIEARKFGEAADEYLKWVQGEHKASTALRITTSFASLKKFFGHAPVHSINPIWVEKYKTWRRQECKVLDVTLRHDLHALSPFFQYAVNANWCRENPVKKVSIPADGDAVRDHVVTEEEEKAYFATCLTKFEIERKDGTKEKHGPFPGLHDVARVILDQGMRPDEVLNLRVQDVDFGKGTVKVNQGKTKSARRTLVMTPAVKAIFAKGSAIVRPDGCSKARSPASI